MRISILFSALVLFLPALASAQGTVVPDTVTIERAQVTSVASSTNEAIPGTGTNEQVQTLTVQVSSGPDLGKTITFDNDYTQLTQGETLYLSHTTNAVDGTDYYAVSDPYRIPVLAGLGFLFVVLLVLFGGVQGLRGLAALAGSIILIFFALFPAILHGFSPIIASLGIAGAIVVLGSYVTHGFNRTTSAAVLGMLGTLIITGAIAWITVHAANLSGFSTEENVYLNFDTHGAIDMVQLLLGAIMIGLLGVLYDIAIGQAIAVEELFAAGSQMTQRRVLSRALRIGREHIGALVNTLAIAYVGASLPLLLLTQEGSNYGPLYLINSELFATEIIRILAGSIGLILAVPITTLIAIWMLAPKEKSPHA